VVGGLSGVFLDINNVDNEVDKKKKEKIPCFPIKIKLVIVFIFFDHLLLINLLIGN
jgi:hypothetical protein